MSAAKNIACVGAGPAGLYFAILAKLADSTRVIDVFERDAADVRSGGGVVFSDQTMETLLGADAATGSKFTRAIRRWDNVDVHYRGQKVSSTGHGFSAIGRNTLLRILRERAQTLDVNLHSGQTIIDPSSADYDLIVGADGVHSAVCQQYKANFEPSITAGRNRFIWLSTARRFEAFTFDFRETKFGWFILHGYSHAADASTVIIETSEDCWRRAGLAQASTDDSLAFCEQLFADRLDSAVLMADPRHRSTSQWVKFETKHCRRWQHDNLVLLGDAAHTAHFSIGSGTRMAMEDAIALAHCLEQQSTVQAALTHYQEIREPETLKIVNAARNRMQWFENLPRYANFDPLQFTYSLFTGSQRISHSNMRLRDAKFVRAIEQQIARNAGLHSVPPPMFTPCRLRDLTLKNRIVVSPMAMYSCIDGIPGDFHLAHLGERALGGAGLVMAEMTAPCVDGRITHACAGLWNDDQLAAWKRIVDLVHAKTTASIGIQLGHSGSKGATAVPGQPAATAQRWPLIAASHLPYDTMSQTPRAMTRTDMAQLREQFVGSVMRAAQAGFDVIELHCAHGYLLSGFLSPLTNHRTDEYGGAIDNRLCFPLEVFVAMRAAWPQHKPMFVRISAHDWALGGNTDDDAVVIAAAFKQAGADLIDVSSGQTTPLARPVYGRMYQTPFSDRIRNEVGIATMAVGNIFHHDHVNSIIAAGRADLCAIARPHLADPHWTLRAAAAQGCSDLPWPQPYERARAQFESHLYQSDSK